MKTELATPSLGEDRWAAIARKRIYFGHQSVGHDMMTGVQELVAGYPGGGVKLVELKNGAAPDGPVFVHAMNGVNEQPLTKIEGFEQAMAKAMQGQADVAFYKFCYVDIRAETDVQGLFKRYQASASSLQARFPNTTFVHMTSPLTVVQSGPKAMVKRMLGRPDRWAQDNRQRERFNDLMRQEYGKAHLFDIARLESTWEDGRRRQFNADGTEVGALIDDYSYDGKHLNERGRRWMASNLLDFLSRLPAP